MHAHQYFYLLAVATSFLHVLIIQVAISTVVLSDDNNCPLLLSLPLLPFYHNYTDNYSDDINYNYHAERDKMDQELASARYAELYMSYLAIQHINSKNGIFVNELYDLSCDVNIPYVAVSNHADAAYKFLTSSSSSSTSRKDDKLKENDTAIIMLSNDTNSIDLEYDGSSFCAVIGPVDSEASQGTNLANYIADQPDMIQISPLSFDVDPMDNPQLLHSFFRSSVTVEVLSRNLMKYLSWKERTYVAVLYDSSSVFSSLVWEGLQKHLPTNLTMVGFPHTGNDDVTLLRALTDIQSSKFSTIVWVESQFTDILKVVKAAYQLHLSTSEYMWIVVPHELMTRQAHWSLSMVRGSPFELFSRRVLLYEYNGARIDIVKDENEFIHINDESIHKITNDTLRKISSLIVRPDVDRHNLNITNYLGSAAYLYDSIVSMGLGLCAAKKMHDCSHYNGIRRASFNGLTGHVRYNTLMNERGQESLTIVMRRTFVSVENESRDTIHILESFDGGWIDTNFSHSYIFPNRVRNVDVTNHAMSSITQFFLILTGLITIVGAVYLLLYIYRNNTKATIIIAQPMYLYLHCYGSILLCVSHFLFAGIRGEVWYIANSCLFIIYVRICGVLLICYTCFIKVNFRNVIVHIIVILF